MSTATEPANKARVLSAGRAVFLLVVLALLSPASAYAARHLCATDKQIVFSDLPVGSSATVQSSLFNCGDSTLVLNGIESDPQSLAGFAFSTSCAPGLALAPLASCGISVTFAPAFIGQAWAGIREVGQIGDLIVAYGRGLDSRAGTASIVFTPAQLGFGTERVGTLSAAQTVTVTNTGIATLTFSDALLDGLDPDDFPIAAGTTCGLGVSIAPNESCIITFQFQPMAAGLRSANLTFDAPQLASLAVLSLSGTGDEVLTVDVIEYYSAVIDRYFNTSFAPEIDALDAGLIAGWTRTGRHFAAYPPGTAGANPVCRIYIPPARGNSHLLSASPEECAFVTAIFTGAIEESAEAMDLIAPDPDTGVCPAMTPVAIYRVWNGRADMDHRYLTDRDLRDSMVEKGWVREGYGPDSVMMCSPGF